MLRTLLVGLIVLATVGFVIGTAIERNSGDHHTEPARTHVEGAGEEGEAAPKPTSEHGSELKPLGSTSRRRRSSRSPRPCRCSSHSPGGFGPAPRCWR